MYRHFLVVSLFAYAELSFAAPAGWNCQKNEADEWSCITGSPSSTPPTEPSNTEITPPLSKPPTESKTLSSPVEAVKVEQAVRKIQNEIKVKHAEKPAPLEQFSPANAIAPPDQFSTNPDGWSCTPNTEDESWNCHLVGIDLKGKPQIIDEIEDYQFRLLERAFDKNQERAFKNLLTEFPIDPWGKCDSSQPIAKNPIAPLKHLRDTTPLDITSDFSELLDGEITGFEGNVEMRRADQHLLANMANYDTVSAMLDTQGNVYYSEDGLALFSKTASLDLSSDKSTLRDVLFISLDGPIRGSAEVAYKDTPMLSHYKQAAYTSCRPGNQDWIIHTSRLKMNKETGLGSATNAWLEFKGIPLLYTPYINFPIDDRRTTGFLFPSWGSTDEGGFDLETPFYWNIAPNFDATFRPRYIGKRGALLGGELRYLTEITSGLLGMEYMPFDSIRDKARFHGKIRNTTHFSPGLVTDLDLNYISDDDYFDELGDALSTSDRRHVRSRADLRYNTKGVSLLARGEAYQTIDRTIAKASRPYLKLPQVLLNLGHSFDSAPIDIGMGNEYVNFYRSGSVTGHRFNAKPFITMPLVSSGAYITPKLSFQYTQYLLNDQTAGLSNSITRALPIASVDSGLFFEKEFQFGDSSLLHTIEPRAFYLYIPRTGQDDIPIFDTALNDFTYNSLFREFSFSGIDRIQNANQVSVGLTSRIINSDTGMEYLKLGIGEIFYFKDRYATTPGGTVDTDSLSSVVTELSGRLNEHLSFSSGLHWNPYRHDFTRGHGRLQFVNQPEQVINVGYQYRRNELIQTDVSFRWPIYDNWYGVGRWQYSLKFNSTKESFLGLEKEGCCWRFRLVGRRFVNSISDSAEAELQTGIFMQFELKGLSSFGDKVDEFLEKQISGYQKP